MFNLSEHLDNLPLEDRNSFLQSPQYLFKAQNWKRLKLMLTDFEFIEAKCKADRNYDLLQDFDRALECKKIPELAIVRTALTLALPSLNSQPELTLQSLYNRIKWLAGNNSRLVKQLSKARLELMNRGAWISAESPLPEPTAIGVFTFPFSTVSSLQSISMASDTIAIGTFSGEAIFHRISTGQLITNRMIGRQRIVGISLSESGNSLAYIDSDGNIGLDGSAAILPGRKGESLLLSLENEVLAISSDDALVAWQPEKNEVLVLARDIPAPLKVLRTGIDGRSVLCLAGRDVQTIGIISCTDANWNYKEVPCSGPFICDADLNYDAGMILLLSLDRCLRLLSVETGEIVATLFYEKSAGTDVTGVPERCAFGKGSMSGWAFFTTTDGQVARWNWEQDITKQVYNYVIGNQPPGLSQFQSLASGDLFISTAERGTIVRKGIKVQPTLGHKRSVSAVSIVGSGKIASFSEQSKTLYWHSSSPIACLSKRPRPDLTAIVVRASGDDIVVSNKAGAIWTEPFDEQSFKLDRIRKYFTEPVVSLCHIEENHILAAGLSGEVVKINLDSGAAQTIRRGSGFRTQRRILPAGRFGMFWSFHLISDSYGARLEVSLVHSAKKETVVAKGRFDDIAVSGDGAMLCVAGNLVEVMRKRFLHYHTVFKRDTPIKHVSFLGDSGFLAVIPASDFWLEIWKLDQGLPTVGAIDLPEVVTCMAASAELIAIGFRSGHLLSLKFCQSEGTIE